ncbi:hypothetical protein [Priestia aryabhattai]
MSVMRSIELKLRYIMICFCSFLSLYALLKLITDNLGVHININNGFILSVLVVFSILVGWGIISETTEQIGEFLKLDDDDGLADYLQVEFIYSVSLIFLFFFTQLGLMLFFFTDFQYRTTLFGFKEYNVLFLIDSIVLYIMYRLTFLKFK